MFEACTRRDETAVKAELRRRAEKGPEASVEDAFRQVHEVWWDDGRTLWITFHHRRMYYARLDPNRPREKASGVNGAPAGSRHYLDADGWRSETLDGTHRPLLKDDLAGHLGMVTQYRGTVCAPRDEDYVLRRIQGLDSEVSVNARTVIGSLEQHIQKMLGELTPGDFEVLVDMVFAASGWRRTGATGGTIEGVDLVLVRSSTGGAAVDPLAPVGHNERVAVQVKMDANQKVFDEYAKILTGDAAAYTRALFVHCNGDIANTHPARMDVVGPSRLAPMVLDAGLTRWLWQHVR
jgi:hypothetical protein